MIDIMVSDMSKYFGDTPILLNIDFEIYEGRHVGLVGKNGSGKTTLFRVITGEYTPDEGKIIIPDGKKLGILDQMPVYASNDRVCDVLRLAFSPLYEMRNRLSSLEEAMANGDSSAVKQYGALSIEYETRGGYEIELEYKKVCNGLDIDEDMQQKNFSLLSGGEQTRVQLARLILEKTDILLLDEPTNHLDMNSIAWLEEYIISYKGTVVVVSHDRYFLDRTTDMTIELEKLHSTVYNGNYSFYAEEKESRLALQEKLYEREQKEISRLDYTAKRMRGWGMGDRKMMRRAIALERRIEKIHKTEKVVREKGMTQSFKESDRSGNDVCYVRGITKSYGTKLFSNVTFDIKKDESIALIGDNGSGKTTMLKILLGELEPDEGRVRWGSNVKIAYLPQKVFFKSQYNSVLDEVVETLKLSPASARNRLGSFHFIGDDVFKMIGDLSGGEKSRLRLCILMNSEINMLILDEPTNHLDIDSCEWMESAIESFDGTLLFVSHDRYFINRFATRIIELEHGEVRDFEGTFEQYRVSLANESAAVKTVSAPAAEEKPREKAPSAPAPKAGLAAFEEDKRKREREKQLRSLERAIDAKEKLLASIQQEINDKASEHEALLELIARLEEETKLLDGLYSDWEEMNK